MADENVTEDDIGDITLEQFVKRQKLLMREWQREYREGISNNPDDFPAKMGHADWEEQFVLFTEGFMAIGDRPFEDVYAQELSELDAIPD